ncbi:MAG: tetratricopeptide repeat protein [Sheuella sp.]|nr:tetratricopeptide repeat protein [Sheuella sp.]
MTRLLRLVLTSLLLLGLSSACTTYAPTVAQGLELYDEGDYTKAFQTLDKLAREGNTQAQQVLGVMYENGQGVKKDERQAIVWFRQAADANNASAQYLLGSILERQAAGSETPIETLKWYRLAATNGHPSAQYRMGQLELKATKGGAAPDLLKASYWFGLAAVQGDPQAQLQYGLLIMQGRTGRADRVLGYMWVDIAQGLGDNATIQDAIVAARSLSSTELQSAKKMSTQCIKQNYQSCSRLPR